MWIEQAAPKQAGRHQRNVFMSVTLLGSTRAAHEAPDLTGTAFEQLGSDGVRCFLLFADLMTPDSQVQRDPFTNNCNALANMLLFGME
jgi:hypothetical protein